MNIISFVLAIMILSLILVSLFWVSIYVVLPFVLVLMVVSFGKKLFYRFMPKAPQKHRHFVHHYPQDKVIDVEFEEIKD